MPTHITLTDNTISSFSNGESHSKIHAYQDLQTVSGLQISELCEKNANLLVFPHCLDEHKNGIYELSICELVGSPNINSENQITDVENVKIKTGNLMGFVGFSGKGHHGTKLEIRSRFTNNQGQDFFMHYMLEKVFKINLFDMSYSYSKNDGFDLLFLIFPHLLKQALRQGVFRTYKTFEKNDAAIKGVIDINRHIKYNQPFNGKIAYRSREYSADNDMTQLIRHTIEFIKQKSVGQNILNNDPDTKSAVNQIIAATDSTYCFQNRGKIIHKNIKPVTHPYFSAYKYLQKLCLLILSHQSIQYSQSNSPVYGILFDGAWLWEEYVATILRDSMPNVYKFQHPENKTGKGGIKLFDNSEDSTEDKTFSKCYRKIYPDFYRQNSKSGDFLQNDGIILDAKYKHLENGFVRDDLYQIISYMHTMEISCGGFIYPLKTEFMDVKFSFSKLAGLGGKVCAIPFPVIQTAGNYEFFKTQMKKAEKILIDYFMVKSFSVYTDV